MESVEKLLNEITETFETFKADAEKETNKAAARRARVNSVKLAKLLKKFRETSVK